MKKLTKVNIHDIKSNDDNPRFINDLKFKKLVKSIKEFPEMLDLRPIVVDEDMVILGGNMRHKACIEAGIKEIPITIAKGLTDNQKKEFIIKDNVGFGEWDWDLLEDWNTDDLNDWGLDTPEDWDEVLEAEEDNYTEPDDLKVDVVLGDLIEIGEHRLLCGDSTDSDQVAKLMNGEKADMVFTDPPYNIDYQGVTKGKHLDYIKKMIDKIDNPEKHKKLDKRKNNGGARAGAGRPSKIYVESVDKVFTSQMKASFYLGKNRRYVWSVLNGLITNKYGIKKL